MSVSGYDDLRSHIGHKIVCVGYGGGHEDPDNVAIECETCNCVLFDFNWDEVGVPARPDDDDRYLFMSDNKVVVIPHVSYVGGISGANHSFFVVSGNSTKDFSYSSAEEAFEAHDLLLSKIKNYYRKEVKNTFKKS